MRKCSLHVTIYSIKLCNFDRGYFYICIAWAMEGNEGFWDCIDYDNYGMINDLMHVMNYGKHSCSHRGPNLLLCLNVFSNSQLKKSEILLWLLCYFPFNSVSLFLFPFHLSFECIKRLLYQIVVCDFIKCIGYFCWVYWFTFWYFDYIGRNDWYCRYCMIL